MGDTSVTMRARVEIEIIVGTWGDEVSLRDMRDQLRREASNIITGRLVRHVYGGGPWLSRPCGR